MSLTNSLRQPLGLELESSPRVQRIRGQLVRDREATPNLPIAIRSDEPFEAHLPSAAAATPLMQRDADGVTLWLHMPAGGQKNTQAVWDPQRHKLSIGVWSRPVPRTGEQKTSGRLLWHSAAWLPGVDGARATASIARGWIGVRLPHATNA